MVGNVTPVTAAPAGTSAPSVPRSSKPTGSADVAVSGKEPLPPGGDLPLADPAELAKQVERAVRRLNELMKDGQRSLRFQVDEFSGRTVITVLDAITNEVVRQIPPPEWLEVVRRLEQAGALIDARS
jgi:flagellar protein FlaG